jgi:hypothetical protein
METIEHVTTRSRYAAEVQCRRLALEASRVAMRTMDPAAAERARMDAAAWLDLATMINAMRSASLRAGV